MGLLPFKNDLLVYIAGADKPKKYTWKEFGKYLAKESFLSSQDDIRAMRENRNSEIFTKFVNNPIGVRMLSTAFFLWSNYKAISPLMRKGNEEKNRQEFFLGYKLGLAKLDSGQKQKNVFVSKHIDFMTRYYQFLIHKTQERNFNPGTTYSSSLYKFYKIDVNNDPILVQEKTANSNYMNKRLIDCNTRMNRKLTIKVL